LELKAELKICRYYSVAIFVSF